MVRPYPAIDRRALLTGHLPPVERVLAPPGGEIASVLVQVRPERLAAAEQAITALAGCEIYQRDVRGKLVIVVDAPDPGSLGTTLNAICMLPDIYSASLVFHALDTANA